MVRPDALPVFALGTAAVCPPDLVATLFGPGATLRGGECLALVNLGADVAQIPVEPGAALALRLDTHTQSLVGKASALRLRGPRGAVDAPSPSHVATRLVLPDSLRSAWRMGPNVVLGLGDIAVRAEVIAGREVRVEIDRSLWLGAGSPETARWLPGLELGRAESAESAPECASVDIPRRVVTETDVRQARLHGKTIRVLPGQVVTPAAQSMAREHGVFATS